MTVPIIMPCDRARDRTPSTLAKYCGARVLCTCNSLVGRRAADRLSLAVPPFHPRLIDNSRIVEAIIIIAF